MTNTVDKMPKSDSISVAGLASSYEAGAHIVAHTHPVHQIVHSISGVLRVITDDAAWIVPPGRGLWVPAQITHEIICINLVEMRTVYLGGEHISFRQELQVVSVSPLMREIIVRLGGHHFERQVPHLTALLLDEIAVMDVEPFRLPTPRDARIVKLFGVLRDDPSDARSLVDWARELGYSPRSLMRHIRSETGMSFRELKRQTRVMMALELLALGHPVTRVALDVGFENPSAFSYAFRMVTGATPRSFYP